MTFSTLLLSGTTTVGLVLAAMAIIAAIEALLPLRPRGRWNRRHLAPNLALTFITFATNIFLNAALVMVLVWLDSRRFGASHFLGLEPPLLTLVVVVALDFSFYVAHVAMHRIPQLWRFHRVHHSDPAVDVTTTIRQHPGESVIRYAFLAAAACALGAAPAAFAIYRVWSVLNGLLEHANTRVPLQLERLLSMVVVTPNMHKVHHSRVASETNTNYGNIFSVFDRLFATFTPAARGVRIAYGLDGHDEPTTQTVAGLLATPFRQSIAEIGPPISGATSGG